jgi:hypothetical protein
MVSKAIPSNRVTWLVVGVVVPLLVRLGYVPIWLELGKGAHG